MAQIDAECEAAAARELRANGWLPYSETAPQTDDLRVLRAELQHVRSVYGRGSSKGLEAFQRLNAAAARAGMPLDGLRRFSRDEAERFFAQTVLGPDGHVYWDGARGAFTRNDGRSRTPARWWWEHVHGEIGTTTMRVSSTCGDEKCINPEHSECRHFVRERYTDEQIIGALQVFAMREGQPPTKNAWIAKGMHPVYDIVRVRFGSWSNAVKAAGLQPVLRGGVRATPDLCIASLRHAKTILGRWPAERDYRENADLRATLREAGLPSSRGPIATYLGRWAEALEKAGKR